jgi:hypothetical protein
MQEQSTHRCACSTRSAATAAVEPLRPGTNAVPITAGIALFHERLPHGLLVDLQLFAYALSGHAEAEGFPDLGQEGCGPEPGWCR